LYRYDWIWNKKRITAPFLAKKQPLRQHEIISVFYKKQCNYYPIPTKKSTGKSFSKKEMTDGKGEVYRGMKRKGVRSENEYGYPKTILNDIPVVTNMSKEKFVHPTQKPVALMEYLIKT
jgi:site-specific DNA-methyltransferase (adenine-specific)